MNKKHMGFVALLAIATLPACSSGSGYHNSQYPEQENREYTAADHKEWREAKLNAMVDHFFDEADTNDDGYISWKEFQSYMRKKFRDADQDHDGMLSRDEVMDMMRGNMQKIDEQMREDKESMHHDNDNADSHDDEQR